MTYCTAGEAQTWAQVDNLDISSTPVTVAITGATILAELGFVQDATTVAVTAAGILAENNYTTPTATVLEPVLQNAIDYVNLQARTSIAALSGNAGAMSSTMSRSEAQVVKSIVTLFLRAFKDRGPNISVSQVNISSTIQDPQYQLFSKLIDQNTQRLATFALANVEAAIDSAIDDVNLQCGTNIAHLAGGPPKTVSMKSGEAAVVKKVVALALRPATAPEQAAQQVLDAMKALQKRTFLTTTMGGKVYSDAVTYAIAAAGRAVENFTDRDSSFFTAGGKTYTDQILNGAEQVWMGDDYPLVKFPHIPLLSVTSVAELVNSAWVTRTVNDDYTVDLAAGGIRFLQNVPAWTYGNLKITYVAGYAATPGPVADVTARLAGDILRWWVLVKTDVAKAAAPQPDLTEAMKAQLKPYAGGWNFT